MVASAGLPDEKRNVWRAPQLAAFFLHGMESFVTTVALIGMVIVVAFGAWSPLSDRVG